jgi:membrane protein
VKETRSLWVRSALAVGLTLLGGGALIVAFAIMVVGQVEGQKIAQSLGLGSISSHVFTLARWPIVIGLITVAMAFLYWATPNVKLPFKLITPGAILFTIGWLVGSYGFGLYVANFGSYNATYGALGGIVILLFWFYLTGFVMLLGGEVNAMLAEEVAPQEMHQSQAETASRRQTDDSRPEVKAGGESQPQPAPGQSLANRPAAAQPASPRPLIVTIVGFVVAALTFWRLARPILNRA